jgi:hypothetical protein
MSTPFLSEEKYVTSSHKTRGKLLTASMNTILGLIAQMLWRYNLRAQRRHSSADNTRSAQVRSNGSFMLGQIFGRPVGPKCREPNSRPKCSILA